MIISPAYAQAAGVTDGGFATLLPLVLIFVVFFEYVQTLTNIAHISNDYQILPR